MALNITLSSLTSGNFYLTVCPYYICLVILSKQAFIIMYFSILPQQFYEGDGTNIITAPFYRREYQGLEGSRK